MTNDQCMLHENLIELLNYIDKVCNSNSLSYMLSGGTALGAVRHKGFIPWDDDVDVAMPRADYERFINIVREDNQYYLQDENSEKNYFHPFIKIRKKNTIFRDVTCPYLFENNGIFVDIFPLDYTDSTSSFLFRINFMIIKTLEHVLRFRSCKTFYREKKSKISYLLHLIFIFPFNLLSNKTLLGFIKKRMLSRNSKEKKYIVSYGGSYSLKRESWPIQMILPPKKIFFENKMYYTYADVISYLCCSYGEYERLPPVEKRHSHKPVELKFDK